MYKITFDTYNEDYVSTLYDALNYWKTGVSVYTFIKCDDSGVDIENFPRYWVEKKREWRQKNPYLVDSYLLAEGIKTPTKAHLYTLEEDKWVYSGIIEVYAIKNGCVQLKLPIIDRVFQYAGLNLDTEYVLVNTTAVPGFEKKEDLHFKLKGVFDKAGNMTGVEVVVLSGGVEAPESVAIREDGNLGVLVNYICDKNTTPIVIPGTGAVPGLITIIVGIVSLGTGTALVLNKEDE